MINKIFLQELYYKENRSLKEISEILGLPKTTLWRRFKSFGLEAKKPIAWNKGLTCFDDKRILSGENHPRWKDHNKYYIEYKLKKKKMIKDGLKCSKCNKNAFLLHHIDKDTKNNKSKNLLPLCHFCHTILHNKERGISAVIFECKYCGKEFETRSDKRIRKFCSLSCSSKYHYHQGCFNIRGSEFKERKNYKTKK